MHESGERHSIWLQGNNVPEKTPMNMSCNGETNNGNQQYQTTIHSRMTDNAQNQNRRPHFKMEKHAIISNRITHNVLVLQYNHRNFWYHGYRQCLC